MDVLVTCAYCKETRRRQASNLGRTPLYCSLACRREAEYAERRKTRSFDAIRQQLLAEGEGAVRSRLANDPDFADSIIDIVETHLKPPDGRVEVDIDPEVLDLLFSRPRRFSVIGHDNPLPGSADIDLAEQTGDWRPMIRTALRDMTWQLASGYKPDLRELHNA